MHYNWHRYYDPRTGRYLTADPIGIEGGINLYLYSMDNPINHYDFLGLVCGSWWNDWIVPDKPRGYDFTGCCKAHDNCYGKECDKSKKQCDDKFCDCLDRVCRLRYLSVRECHHLASIYCSAVKRWGGGAFEDARAGEPCCQK